MFRYINSIFFLTFAFVTIAFFWLKLTMVDEVIRAVGAIEPEGKVQTVQPRFQSVVQELNASVGDKVAKGELLVSLTDEESKAQLEENLSSLQVLGAEIIRLKAEVTFAKKIEWSPDVPQTLQVSQENLFASKRQNMSQQILVIDEEAKLIKNKISDIKQQIEGAQRLKSLKWQEKEIYSPLIQSGAEPKVRLVKINQEIQKLVNEITNLNNKVTESIIELNQNGQRKKGILSDYKANSFEELANKENEREIIKTKTNALRERVSANQLLSPVNGFITKVMPSGPGAVVKSGEAILEIVPISSKILVKANLSPQNINDVKVGQLARVNLLSYDFTRYGSLAGTVRSIAQNTTISENGEVFYNIWVECRSAKLSKSDEVPTIIPGMLVQVEITGNDRSVLDYLLQPIIKSGSQAFSEKG